MSKHLSFTVVKAHFWQEDPEDPLSAAVRVVQIEPATDDRPNFSTRKSREDVKGKPYFNDAFDFDVASGVDSMRFLLEVLDADRGEPMFFSECVVLLDQSAQVVAEKTLELSLKSPCDDRVGCVSPPSDAVLGSITVKYVLVLPKPKKEYIDPNADLMLPEAPKVTGVLRLVPESPSFLWWNLIRDKAFYKHFEESMVLSYSGEDAQKQHTRKSRDVPVKTLGDIVTTKWKAKRSHQVFTKLRLSVEKFARGEFPLTFTPEQEAERKLALKEFEYLTNVRVTATVGNIDTFTLPGDNKLKDSFERLYMLYAIGLPLEAQAPTTGYTVKSQMNATEFGQKQKEGLQAALLRLFIPSLPPNVAQSIAHDDFDHKNAQPMVKGESIDEDLALKGQRAFMLVIRGVINRFVETHTDAEYLNALHAVGPAVEEARLKVGPGGNADPATPEKPQKPKSGSASRKRR